MISKGHRRKKSVPLVCSYPMYLTVNILVQPGNGVGSGDFQQQGFIKTLRVGTGSNYNILQVLQCY